jgi:hypothetical protein
VDLAVVPAFQADELSSSSFSSPARHRAGDSCAVVAKAILGGLRRKYSLVRPRKEWIQSSREHILMQLLQMQGSCVIHIPSTQGMKTLPAN